MLNIHSEVCLPVGFVGVIPPQDFPLIVFAISTCSVERERNVIKLAFPASSPKSFGSIQGQGQRLLTSVVHNHSWLIYPWVLSFPQWD